MTKKLLQNYWFWMVLSMICLVSAPLWFGSEYKPNDYKDFAMTLSWLTGSLFFVVALVLNFKKQKTKEQK